MIPKDVSDDYLVRMLVPAAAIVLTVAGHWIWVRVTGRTRKRS